MKHTPLQIPRQEILNKSKPEVNISQLARDIGISQPYLSLILHGKRQLNSSNKFHQKISKKLQTV